MTPPPRIAYLFPAFPVFHQTFVLWEVLGLRAAGLAPKIYSLRGPSARQQPEGERLIPEVTYLPPLVSIAVLRSNGRRLARGPAAYAALYREVVRAWRTGAARPQPAAGGGSPVSRLNRLRGWWNMHPVPYLLRSLLLVPVAAHLAEELEREGIAHVHAHWATYPATVALLVKRISGIPFSLSAHAYDIYMVQRMLPAKIREASLVFTCARANADFLRTLAPEAGGKIVVSYHGVDVTRFSPAPQRPPSGDALRIVSCGQLERYKGMHVLVDACARLARENVPLRCHIVGDGPERAALERQIDAAGLRERVELAGPLPQERLAESLRAADVFVLASELAGRYSRRRDVIANAIVEAMAVGLPVVASRLPGVEELVEDGRTGLLVTSNRADELARALRRLADDPALREALGANARERVLRDFDAARNVRRIAESLQSLAAGAPR